MENPTDEEIKEILKSARNVAVVGLSDRPGRDSHRIAAYLKTRGSCVMDRCIMEEHKRLLAKFGQ